MLVALDHCIFWCRVLTTWGRVLRVAIGNVEPYAPNNSEYCIGPKICQPQVERAGCGRRRWATAPLQQGWHQSIAHNHYMQLAMISMEIRLIKYA